MAAGVQEVSENLMAELLSVREQLARERRARKQHADQDARAEAAQQALLAQVEKNYAVAQRVHAERARREEGDHYIKGLREQMRSAAARAVQVASELEREKAEHAKLRAQLAKRGGGGSSGGGGGGVRGAASTPRTPAAAAPATEPAPASTAPAGTASDHDEQERQMAAADSYSEDEYSGDDAPLRDRHGNRPARGADAVADGVAAAAAAAASTGTSTGRKKRRRRKGRKAKRKKRAGTATATGARPQSAMLAKARSDADPLGRAKMHNADLFRRLADAKRAARAARAESDTKSEQLHALSNHLEKMMALLRAEAAAKASAEEALRSTEDELAAAKDSKAMLARELAGVKLSAKDEMARDAMLAKQLELMDEKYAVLLRTNNFNRAREARQAKDLRAKMHATTERMHTMMRRCEDAETASRNTAHAFSRLLASLHLLDRTPFRALPSVAGSGGGGGGGLRDVPDVLVLELQDCSLGDNGALAVADALNAFVSLEAEKHDAVTTLRAANARTTQYTNGTPASAGTALPPPPPVSASLVALRRPPVHISVNLSYNGITDAADSAVLKSLCRSLVATHSITEVDLRGNFIGPAGLKMVLDALQYNEGVRAVDLSGNLIGEADLLEYINSAKHLVGLPTLRMLSDGGAKEVARVEVHESLAALDHQSRLRRHGVRDGKSGVSGGVAGNDAAGRRRRGRPASAPLGGRGVDSVLGVKKPTAEKREVVIDFPPNTSAVNAVQRVILDSISRVEAHNPFRRTSDANARGRQALAGDGGGAAAASGAGAGGDASARRGPPDSARSARSSGSARESAGTRLGKERPASSSASSSSSSSSSIRSRLRLPPKRAASAALLRTPAGLTPSARKAKYHDEEQKMMKARKEARMLREAQAQAALADRKAAQRKLAAKQRRRAGEGKRKTGGRDEFSDEYSEEEAGESEEKAASKVSGAGEDEEKEKTPRPKYGGMDAHEVFWPAFACARSGDYSGLTEWLEKGMRVEHREPSTGQSLLMATACSSSEISMRMLIRKGGRVNGQCNKGWTPLHHCIASGTSHLYMADQLISRGAKTEMRDMIGVTPLQLAVEQGSADAICRLIEAGADITTADDEGRTVLHRCAACECCCFCCATPRLAFGVLTPPPPRHTQTIAPYSSHSSCFFQWVTSKRPSCCWTSGRSGS